MTAPTPHQTPSDIPQKAISKAIFQSMKHILSLLLLLCCATASAQLNTKVVNPPHSVKYRLYLHDKAGSAYSTDRPEEFLSQKAIERRRKFGLKVDEHDLPVSAAYLAAISKAGGRIVSLSKWNNTVVVELPSAKKLRKIQKLACVDSTALVYTAPKSLKLPSDRDEVNNKTTTTANAYGYGYRQAEMIGADSLHAAGFRGEGVTIAIIDGGFHNADRIAGLRDVRILGTRNFVRPENEVYLEESHGMMVLSCIGSNVENTLVGTAPGAAFYLLVSEDGSCEFPVEEDYWCAAAEYADSLGADLITTSLGYNTFDDKSLSHTHAQLDGRTAVNSRAASLCASRGLVFLNSAGNSGGKDWEKIGFPADATDILAVGAVRPDGIRTSFSSTGYSSDLRVKPDVMAQGQNCAVFDTDGSITRVAGTSFSTPILAGAVACLMQACPDKTPLEIMDAVRRTADRAGDPNPRYGYGIANVWHAYKYLKGQ